METLPTTDRPWKLGLAQAQEKVSEEVKEIRLESTTAVTSAVYRKLLAKGKNKGIVCDRG